MPNFAAYSTSAALVPGNIYPTLVRSNPPSRSFLLVATLSAFAIAFFYFETEAFASDLATLSYFASSAFFFALAASAAFFLASASISA
jgi:hypothetical protein